MAGGAPSAYGVTFPMDGSNQFDATMKYNQFSAYIQDQVNFSDRFRLTAGLRFELPIYPELKNNYNKAFAAMQWEDGGQFKKTYVTDQLPDAPLTVSSAYYNNRYSVNGNNDVELGYGTYVAPNRLLISASYKKDYGKNFGSEVGLIYEGMNIGYAGGYSCTRYSYTMSSNIVNDYGSNNLIMIPGSREALEAWTFADNGDYTAEQQKDDFWNYIEQDSYLKNHKGQYAERGGAVMPWHHQLDFKFNQNFYLKVGGQKNTLQFGVDIKNLANLLNSSWGLYKSVFFVFFLAYLN